MKRADLIRHLEAHRCFFVREGSKHTVYRNPVNGYSTTIPPSRDQEAVSEKDLFRFGYSKTVGTCDPTILLILNIL
jgi:predicted RNA binding protein YcfA (HicA-like mRNA interferase family)